jgi:glyoxylase-like metal-dependent hydrolase (beta-lactamase superfamily II)
MKITFLGTGSAFNHANKNNAAILEFNDTNLLVDCGHTVPTAIDSAIENGLNIKLENINNIFITHMHGDHIYGLEEIAFKNRFLYNNRKINLFIPREIYSLFKVYFESTTKYSSDSEGKPITLTLEDYFNVKQVSGWFKINGEMFVVEKTDHIPGASAFRLIGEKFIYTGDTQLIDWDQLDINGIEYIFHDTQLSKYGNDVHATLPDILNLPEEIRSKIYCMHYGNDIETHRTEILNAKMHIVKTYETINL